MDTRVNWGFEGPGGILGSEFTGIPFASGEMVFRGTERPGVIQTKDHWIWWDMGGHGHVVVLEITGNHLTFAY